MASRKPRPARTLLIFFVTIGVLYGLAAIGGTWKPRLGLDLEGGTRITLSATTTGDQLTEAKLKEAASIVDRRVNGTGVSEAEVSTQGSRNIIVEIPGKNASSLVDSVKRTAQLRFRLVVGQPQPGTPVTEPSAGASPSASPSGQASPSAKASPKKKQQNKKKQTASPSPTASANPRPAPFATTPSPSASASPAPSGQATAEATPAPTAEATPTQTAAGASVDDPLAWVQNPGEQWLAKFAAYTCPTGDDAAASVTDDPSQPLIACDENGQKLLMSKSVIEGTSLRTASYGTPQNGVGWVVTLSLKGDARKVFGDISQKLVANGGLFAIVLDGQVLSSPGFDGAILDGNAEIRGDFTESEARSLSNSLKYGALPLKFDSTTETVGPSLAGNQLSAGILAGIIGLAIVMIYCLFYYRGLGLVVIASLVVAAVITYGVVLVLAKAASFTLTLPGIAGLIVAVGITADSFIVYFERIRDEMRDGRSMRVAVETGWARARNTCLAADAVSILAAIVLYIFAIGVVRGFAFALGVSTIIDIVVFFWFTKPMMTLLAKRKFFNGGGKLSGLSAETLGIDELPSDRRQLAGGRA